MKDLLITMSPSTLLFGLDKFTEEVKSFLDSREEKGNAIIARVEYEPTMNCTRHFYDIHIFFDSEKGYHLYLIEPDFELSLIKIKELFDHLNLEFDTNDIPKGMSCIRIYAKDSYYNVIDAETGESLLTI